MHRVASILIVEVILLQTAISAGLRKKKRPNYAWSALLDPEFTDLNRIVFRNDNITHLFLDNHLESLNGIKCWPIYLESLWIMNMKNFSMQSLRRIPQSVTAITLSRNHFKAHSGDHHKINLPKNLESLAIQLCETSHETIAALNIAPLSELVELHLIYLGQTQYSDQYPIIFPVENLEILEINFDLMQNILTHQKGQSMHKLRYVMVNIHKGERMHRDKVRELKESMQSYFNVRNLTVDASDKFRFDNIVTV